jgi:haloacid dehalogenase superfamily, subfamily IA, variant 3 with third motif having DD or ED
MNFIFDIGNVLIDFKPEQFLHTILKNPIYESKMNEIIFKSIEWVKLDEGTITSKEACLNLCIKEPEYKELIIAVMEKLPLMLTPIPKTIKLLPKIKKFGHKLYYLSNYHKELSRYIQDKYSFLKLFEGGVFSCDVHMLKPSTQIYKYILDKYKLDAKDCVFFDDIEENVAAAEKSGMMGVLFTGADKIESFISMI